MVQKLLGKYWRNVPGIPDEVWDMWEELTASPEATMGKGKSRKIKAFGCDVVLGLGGLHGAPSKPLRVGKCRHKDVKSMYPSAICHLGALGDATPVYDQIRQERIRIKHSDPLKAAALKLILNSVYGLFKNQYSTLCNPLASSIVCIYGMISLFSLCRELDAAGYRIININTDGVVYESGRRPLTDSNWRQMSLISGFRKTSTTTSRSTATISRSRAARSTSIWRTNISPTTMPGSSRSPWSTSSCMAPRS